LIEFTIRSVKYYIFRKLAKKSKMTPPKQADPLKCKNAYFYIDGHRWMILRKSVLPGLAIAKILNQRCRWRRVTGI